MSNALIPTLNCKFSKEYGYLYLSLPQDQMMLEIK